MDTVFAAAEAHAPASPQSAHLYEHAGDCALQAVHAQDEAGDEVSPLGARRTLATAECAVAARVDSGDVDVRQRMGHRPADGREGVARLPDDIWLLIAREHLRPRDLGRLTQVSHYFCTLCASDDAWAPHLRRARERGIVRKIVLQGPRERPYPRIPAFVVALPSAPRRTLFARMVYYFYAVVLDREHGRFLKYSVAHSRNRQARLRRLRESGLLSAAFLWRCACFCAVSAR